MQPSPAPGDQSQYYVDYTGNVRLISVALPPGATYTTAGDLLATQDLFEDTVCVWGKFVRVSGLGLELREEIRAKSWRPDGQRDTMKLIKAYLKHGITAPRMNDEQIDRFVRKHAWAAEAVYLYIDRLTELPYELIVAQALALAGLAPGNGQDTPTGTDSADDGSMDRPAGAGSGDAPAGVHSTGEDEGVAG